MGINAHLIRRTFQHEAFHIHKIYRIGNEDLMKLNLSEMASLITRTCSSDYSLLTKIIF